MGIAPKTNDGFTTSIPGVYTKQEFPAGRSAGAPTLDVVAIVGSALAGIPYNAPGIDDEDRAPFIRSVPQAQAELRGGALYYGNEFFLDPTNDPSLSRPSRVRYIRIDPAEQAEDTIYSGAGSAAVAQIDLTAKVWGNLGNQISRKITAGTNIGKKVSIKDQGVTVIERDDIGLIYMAIQYVGAGSAATMSISNAALTTAVTAGPGGENLNIDLTSFKKLSQLVSFINEKDAYTCILKASSDVDTSTFDVVTAQDIKTSVYSAKADVEALIQFFNNNSQGRYTAVASGQPRAAVTNDTVYVFATGGTDGTYGAGDWSGALDLCEKLKINYVIPMSGDLAVQAMFAEHVDRMSQEAEKKNRATGFGCLKTTSFDDMRTAAREFAGNARCEFWGTPFKRRDRLNPTQTTPAEFDPYYLAAMVAGIRFGNDITTDAVFKWLKIDAVMTTYSRSEIELLTDAGVSTVGPDEDGSGRITVINNVTTFQGSDNQILNIPSMLRTADAVTLDSQGRLKARMASLRRAPNQLQINEMTNYVTTNLLPGYVTAQWLESFDEAEFSRSADSWTSTFTGVVTSPLRFIFQKQRFVVNE